MKFYIRCPHCGLVEIDTNQQIKYAYRGRLLGTQCPTCNSEVNLVCEDSVGNQQTVDQQFVWNYLKYNKIIYVD